MSADAELLAAWSDGDNGAGQELFARHFDAIYRFFRNKVGGDIDDLVQRTFLGCAEARERFRGDASVRTFLFAIARNILYEHLRAGYKERDELDFAIASVADLATSPSELVVRDRDHRLLLEALRRIPLEDQIAIELHYWEGLSSPEVGEVLNLKPATVRARLAKARERLAEKMEELGGSPELAQSTIDNLERWAAQLREYLVADS